MESSQPIASVSMIALGGPKLKHYLSKSDASDTYVSMIALGGPKLKHIVGKGYADFWQVSMIALGGPKLKHIDWDEAARKA